MNPKSVFITGGAGFIGRWVVERCLREGLRVAVYDNLCAGRIGNIVEFLDRIDFYEADILDVEALGAALKQTQPDVVIHLAAHHFIPFCNAHPQETLRVNVEGTQAVLDLAVQQGVQRAVVASTGGLYPSLDGLLHEDTPPAPPDIYGLSKLLVEHVAQYYARTTSLSCVVARLFNTYGPYETNPHLIPHIMESLHEGFSVELGNIHTKRDYIYVEDVAHLLFECARADASFAVTNVGTGIEYSAEDIVHLLGELIGQEIRIDIDQDRIRAVDKMYQRADTTRMEVLTGVLPAHTLHEGLTKLLEHEQMVNA